MPLDEARGHRLYGSSADGAAILRAVGAADPDPQLRCPDYLARRLVGDLPVVALVDRPRGRRLLRAIAERRLPGALWFDIARLKHFDALLGTELAAGAGQLVILGAGLDSRAYRFGAELDDVRVFEVDHPATAVRKRERVRAVLGSLPDNVTYVEADLERTGLEDCLGEAGFDPQVPTFVIWSGVTMYLDGDAVGSVLAWAAGLPESSSICFDHVLQAVLEDEGSVYGAPELRAYLAKLGEPLRFGLAPGSVGEFLNGYGLALDSHLMPDQFAQRYLRGSDGQVRRPYGCCALAHARVG